MRGFSVCLTHSNLTDKQMNGANQYTHISMDLDKLIDFCVSGSKNDKVVEREKKKEKRVWVH